jgi:hypothetical protein
MGFVEDYWLEIMSITFSLVALVVSLYSLYLKRLDIEKERLAREVTIGPMDDPLVVDRGAIEDQDEVPVQLVNDTGIPQIVNELWVQVDRYPKEISEEQYVRFKALMLELVEAGLRTVGPVGTEEWMRQQADTRLIGDRRLFLIALMMLIVNRIRQDDTRDVVVDDELYRTLRSSSASLDDIAALLRDPKNDWLVRKLLTPQLVEMLEEHVRSVMSDRGFPLYTSMKLEVPPGAVKDIDLHLMRFARELHDRLDLIGGRFDFLCRVHADVHKGDRMSRSELFTLRLEVEPVDMTSLIGQLEEDLREKVGT